MATFANACPVCIAYPQKSAADQLVESTCVILAREDPDSPFSYAAVETLKGDCGGKQIDLFLDSVTRRILAANPKRMVVLAHDSAAEAWHNLGLASSDYEAVVRRIVLIAPQWQAPEGKLRRAEFFLALFGHEDPAISELAYLEMSKASYQSIKQLSRVVSREQIEPILHSPQYITWRSLAILLLANRGEAGDRPYVAKSFRTSDRFRLTTNLAAWATALIELEANDAVSLIETRYFRNPHRRQVELTEVVKAMSLHGTEGHTHLRDQIVASYRVLLDVHPEMAPQVAADLLTWKRPDLSKEVARVDAAAAGLDYAARTTIRRYLRFAAE